MCNVVSVSASNFQVLTLSSGGARALGNLVRFLAGPARTVEHCCVLLWSTDVCYCGALLCATVEHSCVLLWSTDVCYCGALLCATVEHCCVLLWSTAVCYCGALMCATTFLRRL